MCDFCEKKYTSLTSIYVDLKIDDDIPFTDSVVLTAYNFNKRCPPFAKCCDKDVRVEIHFDIKFCPMCGKELQKVRKE